MIDINLHRIAINQHLWIWVFIICTYTSTGIEIYHICILYLYIVCMHVCISCTSLTKGPHRLVALPNHHLECHPSKIVSICPTLFCMYIRKYTVYAAYKQSRTCVCIVIYYIIYQYWYFFDISVNINIWILIYCIYIYVYLVGGFNPSEKYESQIGSSSQLLGKINNVPNHQPDMY